MAKQTVVQQWREANKGNEEAWKELVAVAESTTPIGEMVRGEYGFTWRAIRDDCVKRGLYQLRCHPDRKKAVKANHDEEKAGSCVSASEEPVSEGIVSEEPVIETRESGDKSQRVFMVDDVDANAGFVTRSIELEENVYKRLKRMEESKWQYKKRLVLNQLLKDALALYGF